MKKILFLLIAPLLFAGCSDDDDEKTLYQFSDIVGVWDSQVSNIKVEFMADGSLRGFQRHHNDEPIIYGTFTLENNIISTTTHLPDASINTYKAEVTSINNNIMKLNGSVVLFTDRVDGTEGGRVAPYKNLTCLKQ